MWLKLVLGFWVITNYLLQQSNKDSRVPVWLRQLYSVALTYKTQTGGVLWGEIITKIKISVVTRVYIVKADQHSEIGSTQKRNLMKSGQHKNGISWKNRVNTKSKSKSREIGSTQTRGLVKSSQHKNEIAWNHVNTRFSIHYTIC